MDVAGAAHSAAGETGVSDAWVVGLAGLMGGGLNGIVLGATAPPLMMKLIA